LIFPAVIRCTHQVVIKQVVKQAFGKAFIAMERMSSYMISRRNFFTKTLGQFASHFPRMIPNPMRNFLCLGEDRPLSAEDAAFILARSPRKKSVRLGTHDSLVHNTAPNLETKRIADKE
jgi:hypothetical protein